MVVQLWAHAKSLDGPDAHRAAIAATLPSSWAIRTLILAPLVFHVVYGVVLTLRPRYNVGRYPLSRNWTYTMQRASGVIALGFICMVLFLFRQDGGSPELLPGRMIATLSRTHAGLPLIAFVHLIGVGACAFHFATGLFTIGIRYGLLSTRARQARAGVLFAALGLVLFMWGGQTVLFMATGWRAVDGGGRAEGAICDPAALSVSMPTPRASTPKPIPTPSKGAPK